MGDNARIAANAVVLSEVPADATAVGIPAQIVRIAGQTTRFADEVDQTSVKDPAQEELQALAHGWSWWRSSWIRISAKSPRNGKNTEDSNKKGATDMYLYNSATHKKEEFSTHTPGHVEMYTCGPTVYHFAHIGNLRSYIMEDVLEKFLRYDGL